MRSNWTGTVQISLLSAGIKLGTAVTDNQLSLHLVRAADGSPVKYKRIAEADGQEVPWAETAKGYDAPDGSLVVLTDEDFERAYGEKNRIASILLFAPENQIPRIASRKFHLVQPDKGSGKTYALLAAALRASGRVAVLTFTMRQRESLAVLRPHGDGYLVLEELSYYADVLQPDFAAPKQDYEPAEEELALKLIDQMSGDFDYAAYTDHSGEALAAVIAEKIEHGQTINAPAAPDGPSSTQQAQDLMSALTASIQAGTPEKAVVPSPRKRASRRKTA